MKTVPKNFTEVIIQSIANQIYRIEENATATIIIPLTHEGEVTVTVRLVGQGAKATIIGLVIGSKKGIYKLHTLQLHESRETTSNLLVKAVLKDEASFSYDGAIRVEKEGQKTDAYQRNENLLLSDHAFAQSKPSLEILANDVRCTHGATISTINEEQLFFLATRGLPPSYGKRLIVEGFLNQALTQIPDKIKMEKAKEVVWQSL